jgi:hypothetical protein
MPFLREMSREKIRKREKYSPEKTSLGREVPGNGVEVGLWTPFSRGRGVRLKVRNFLGL